MGPDLPKPKPRGVRWFVFESHLLEMLVYWRLTREWMQGLAGQGVRLDDAYFYNPTAMILDMLGIPPESDDFHRQKYEVMIQRFRGTNITHLRALFATILRDVFDV